MRRFLALCAALPAISVACGVCVEDKVAATYDHAVVTRALDRRHVVVFAEVAGRGDAKAVARGARAAAASVRGVDRGSVRAAESPAALSFALDPQAGKPEAALAAIERAAAGSGLRLTLLRVMP